MPETLFRPGYTAGKRVVLSLFIYMSVPNLKSVSS